MRALRTLLLAVAVVLGLTLSPLVAAAAESTDTDVMTGPSASWVTFIDQSCSIEAAHPESDGDIERMRGTRSVCEVTFDDPRVSGTVTTVANYDCLVTEGCTTWGTQEIVGPDGSWRGPFTGTIDRAFTERALAIMTGTAGYAGLTLIIHAVGPREADPTVVGLIYEGSAPPMPGVQPAE